MHRGPQHRSGAGQTTREPVDGRHEAIATIRAPFDSRRPDTGVGQDIKRPRVGCPNSDAGTALHHGEREDAETSRKTRHCRAVRLPVHRRPMHLRRPLSGPSGRPRARPPPKAAEGCSPVTAPPAVPHADVGSDHVGDVHQYRRGEPGVTLCGPNTSASSFHVFGVCAQSPGARQPRRAGVKNLGAGVLVSSPDRHPHRTSVGSRSDAFIDGDASIQAHPQAHFRKQGMDAATSPRPACGALW